MKIDLSDLRISWTGPIAKKERIVGGEKRLQGGDTGEGAGNRYQIRQGM